jgi:hypothetical protein
MHTMAFRVLVESSPVKSKLKNDEDCLKEIAIYDIFPFVIQTRKGISLIVLVFILFFFILKHFSTHIVIIIIY